MELGGARKRRKWDVAAPQGVPAAQTTTNLTGFAAQGTGAAAAQPKPGQPLTDDLKARAQQAAAAAVAKISQDLVSQGKLPPGRYGAPRRDDDKEPIVREVVINDAPSQTRYNLTKRPVQDDIARRTNTLIVTRGRYYPPGVPQDETEPPLRLKILPGGNLPPNPMLHQQAVDAAAGEVQAILQGRTGPPRRSPAGNDFGPPREGFGPPSMPPGPAPGMAPGASPGMGPGASPGMGPVGGYPSPAPSTPQTLPPLTTQCWVNIQAPPDFNLAQRLRGPDDSFLLHISRETQSSVTLRGRGSIVSESPEPMHLHVSSTHQRGLDSARKLADNLIGTVRGEFQKAYPYGPPAPAQYGGHWQGQPPHQGPASSYPPTSYPPSSYPPQQSQPPGRPPVPPYGQGPPRGPPGFPPAAGYGPPPGSYAPPPRPAGPPHPHPHNPAAAGPYPGAYPGAYPPPSHGAPGYSPTPNGYGPPSDEQAGQKRRFREFKEEAPAARAPATNPYMQVSDQSGTGPPAKASAVMGPPPPRAMGPPPPRPGGAGRGAGGAVLGGLVDYADDE
ncbi:hypothetical protein WJX74_003775 [Apatococcus lobatus]|uniref:Uncharacterized protein n=1 Tax=Apatococcus lobatus TaxID=904363 RepID=A0AAW1SG54_9CHLO